VDAESKAVRERRERRGMGLLCAPYLPLIREEAASAPATCARCSTSCALRADRCPPEVGAARPPAACRRPPASPAADRRGRLRNDGPRPPGLSRASSCWRAGGWSRAASRGQRGSRGWLRTTSGCPKPWRAALRALRLPQAQPRRRRSRYGFMTPSSNPGGVFGDETAGLGCIDMALFSKRLGCWTISRSMRRRR
jgi:hypothetical protein